jgi:hypothetical protein
MMLKDAPKNVTLINLNDNMKIKVLSNYGPDNMKIKVLDVGEYTGRDYVAGKTKIISANFWGWSIFQEPIRSKISSATVNALKQDIENMESNLKSAKANLEKAEVELKKNIPALIVGGLYKVPKIHETFCTSTFLVIQTDAHNTKTIWFSEETVEQFSTKTAELNDGTLIHLNSSEDKKFAKRLFELTKNFSI